MGSTKRAMGLEGWTDDWEVSPEETAREAQIEQDIADAIDEVEETKWRFDKALEALRKALNARL